MVFNYWTINALTGGGDYVAVLRFSSRRECLEFFISLKPGPHTVSYITVKHDIKPLTAIK
jgi:hypothetical protein